MLGRSTKEESGLRERLGIHFLQVHTTCSHSPNSLVKEERISEKEADFSSKLGQDVGGRLVGQCRRITNWKVLTSLN